MQNSKEESTMETISSTWLFINRFSTVSLTLGMNRRYFKDKVMIITGASSGIGLASAKLFASCGAKLALAARSADKLRSGRKVGRQTPVSGGRTLIGDGSHLREDGRFCGGGLQEPDRKDGREIRQDRHTGEQCGTVHESHVPGS